MPIKWDSVQQILRIALHTGGGIIFGDQIANGELWTAAAGGILNVGAFVWWYFWERDRPTA